MKALVFGAYNHLVYEDAPESTIAANEVLIDVKACGICESDDVSGVGQLKANEADHN